MPLKKLKNRSLYIGLFFTIASAAACFAFTWIFFEEDIFARMQPSIFSAFPNREEFDLYASMDPAKEVGGDFYDYFLIDDDHLGIVIADVSGKGIPAALFMMISKTIVKNFAMLGIGATADPKETLRIVRESVDKFVGAAEQFDDLTMACLEYRGAS